jgi:hypothetical protein
LLDGLHLKIQSEETRVGNKNQGEGDYESARHYNDETRKFVEDKKKKGESLQGNAKEATDELSDAEQTALKHAKSGDQDKRDADALRRMEKKR